MYWMTSGQGMETSPIWSASSPELQKTPSSLPDWKLKMQEAVWTREVSFSQIIRSAWYGMNLDSRWEITASTPEGDIRGEELFFLERRLCEGAVLARRLVRGIENCLLGDG